MYISNQNCKEAWDYDDEDSVMRLFKRIEELFGNPNCFTEVNSETLEVVLTEKDGEVWVIKKDKLLYSLQIEYELQLLDAVIQKFNETPLYFAFWADSFSGKVEFHFIKNWTINNERELTTHERDLDI